MSDKLNCDDFASIRIRRDWVDYLLATMGIITVLLLICGASIASRAKKTYINSNKLETAKLLKDYEKYVYDLADKYPYLQAVFVDVSKEDDPVKRATQQIDILLQNGIEGVNDISHKEIDRLPKWHNIPELVDMLWGPNDFHNKAKVRLRRAHDLAEQILYLLVEAYEAQRHGVF